MTTILIYRPTPETPYVLVGSDGARGQHMGRSIPHLLRTHQLGRELPEEYAAGTLVPASRPSDLHVRGAVTYAVVPAGIEETVTWVDPTTADLLNDARVRAGQRLDLWHDTAQMWTDPVTSFTLSCSNESRALLTLGLSQLESAAEAATVTEITPTTQMPLSMAYPGAPAGATVTLTEAKELLGRLVAYGAGLLTQYLTYEAQIATETDIAVIDAILAG